ncbi:predicted protein [Chaetoceros tenuissimus]|uniref:Uncharacterized protein n=1 Tax=Chaetoceros tenuissimus TaxID=426638 RepID=A0AAD3CCM9_9STRA|nr:predicted protein [Chaetoceros tenuissimus]
MNSYAMEKSGRKRNHSRKTSKPLRSLNTNSKDNKRRKSHNEAILVDDIQEGKKNETAITTSRANDRNSNDENIVSVAGGTTKHVTTLRTAKQASAKPLAKPNIQMYKLQGLTCPNELRLLENATKEFADWIMENGFVANPKSELYSEIDWNQIRDQTSYPNAAVYQTADGKIGATTQYSQRLEYYRQEGKDTNGINIMVALDALTKKASSLLEKSRKDYFTSIGVTSEEPKSMGDLRNNPYFHHHIISHFSEKRGHTSFEKMLDTLHLESCMQFKFGMGHASTSMHEGIPADTATFWKNYDELLETVQWFCKLVYDITGCRISEFTIREALSSWEPGRRKGLPVKFLFSTIVIYNTMHPNLAHKDIFPAVIPSSEDIDQCYNTDHLKDHRFAAQQVCIAAAKEIMNSKKRILRLVDENPFAWSWDEDKKKPVQPGDRHLNVYLSLDYEIKYQDEDITILYTPTSQSFVFFMGPVCQILSVYSFTGKASTATSTKRAFWLEAFRQLCNMANDIEDGGRDNIFGNIWLMYFMTTTLRNQLHADPRWCNLFGKDLLTPRDIFATDSEYTDLPKRTRNTISKKTRTDSKSEDRDGASSGDYEKNIFEQVSDLLTCSDTLEEGLQQVLDHFTNTGDNLEQTSIYKRCENFGKKEYISEKIRNAWITFYRSKRSNRGNSNARGLTIQQQGRYDNSFEGLLSKAREKWNEKPDDVVKVEFKIWLELSDTEKDAAIGCNSELNQPEWKLKGHLQLPYKFESLRKAIGKRNKTLKKIQLKLRQHEHRQKVDRPYVTRNNYKYKLATIIVTRKE